MKNFLGTGPSRDGTVPVPGGTASQKRDGGGTVPEPSWDSPGTGRSRDRPGRDVRNTTGNHLGAERGDIFTLDGGYHVTFDGPGNHLGAGRGYHLTLEGGTISLSIGGTISLGQLGYLGAGISDSTQKKHTSKVVLCIIVKISHKP